LFSGPLGVFPRVGKASHRVRAKRHVSGSDIKRRAHEQALASAKVAGFAPLGGVPGRQLRS
ncbi:MAG: hypothetical protein ACRERT_16605, partial [Pseudomonas sp.]